MTELDLYRAVFSVFMIVVCIAAIGSLLVWEAKKRRIPAAPVPDRRDHFDTSVPVGSGHDKILAGGYDPGAAAPSRLSGIYPDLTPYYYVNFGSRWYRVRMNSSLEPANNLEIDFCIKYREEILLGKQPLDALLKAGALVGFANQGVPIQDPEWKDYVLRIMRDSY